MFEMLKGAQNKHFSKKIKSTFFNLMILDKSIDENKQPVLKFGAC